MAPDRRGAIEALAASRHALRAGAARRWARLDAGARAGAVGIAALLIAAIAVRAWLMLDYGAAFVGFGDSHEYLSAAMHGVFGDPQKPAGYPIFLALAHAVEASLAWTIALQHLLGVATGLLLYAAVRRTGAPAWLGLLPATIALFGGTGLLLEHSLLADPLFAFVQAVAVYAAIRALREPSLRWALLAGLAVGVSFWVKTVGLSGLVLAPVLLLAAPGRFARRAAAAASVAGAAAALVLAYPAVQALATGHWRYERQSAWNLYGRVATFVDCSRFTPPAGTRFLCPRGSPSRRRSQSYYQYAPAAPAVRRYGGPGRAPDSANAVLQRFSTAAIEHEPLAFAAAIARAMGRFVEPRPGEGYTPASIREALFERRDVAAIGPELAAYYGGDRGYLGGVTSALAAYERATRVQGALLIALLLAALLGVPLLPAPVRAAATLLALVALLSTLLAAAGNGYDARYAYPALGPLAAAAALGAWALATRVRDLAWRRGPMPPPGVEPGSTA